MIDLPFDHLLAPVQEAPGLGPLEELRGVGDRGERVAQLVGEHGQELVLAAGVLEQFLLVLPPLGDIAEDEDDPIDLAAGVADGCPAVVDRPLDAVAGDQHRMIGQANDGPIGQDSLHGVLGRLAGVLVDDPEDLVERPAGRIAARPAAEGLGYGIHEGDPPLSVGGDDRVADAGQHGGEPLLAGLGPPACRVQCLHDQSNDQQPEAEERRSAPRAVVIVQPDGE